MIVFIKPWQYRSPSQCNVLYSIIIIFWATDWKMKMDNAWAPLKVPYGAKFTLAMFYDENMCI